MKVFISSTSRDLGEYRAAAIRALRRLGHDVVAMEDFTATTTYPLARVLEQVREADALVVLVAWRYGFKPHTNGIDNLPDRGPVSDPSITEWEYLTEMGKERSTVLAFLLSDTAPWPPQNMDGFAQGVPGIPDSLEQVLAFRARLMRDHVVSFFDTPADLEAKVGAAITTTRLSRQVNINRIAQSDPIANNLEALDSSFTGGILGVVTETRSERVIRIDIESPWWSTRLYLLALLLSRLTGAQRILILQSERFVGLLSLSAIITVIPTLHEEIRAFEAALRARTTSESDLTREAASIVALFEAQYRSDPAHSARPEQQVKVDLTQQNLARWFAESMITTPIQIDDIERASPVDLIRLFDYPSDFVPVVVGTDDESPDRVRPIHVIDRPALSLQLAKSYVAELRKEVGD